MKQPKSTGAVTIDLTGGKKGAAAEAGVGGPNTTQVHFRNAMVLNKKQGGIWALESSSGTSDYPLQTAHGYASDLPRSQP